MSTAAQELKHPHPPDATDVDSPTGQGAIRALRSELAEAGRRLREREDRWDLLVLAAEQGIWDWVSGTDRMDWSPQFTRMLGYAEGEIAPSVAAFNALLHPDDSAAIWRAIDEHVAGKTDLFEAEFRLRAKDGSYRRIHSRGKAKVGERGAAVRVVGLHADITDRKQASESSAPVAPKPAGSVDPRVARTHCKTCNSDLLVRSRWRLWERPMIFLLQRPVRCRTCGRRSFKPLWAGVPRPANARRKYTSNTPSDS
ncbi:MAG TPA: PAS domain-containing protein [Tepidisphaeraceae bacterium]|jgi:PAS domain S-box-containing protein